MPESVLRVGIDAQPAAQGAVVVNRSLDSISSSAEKMCSYLDRIDRNLEDVSKSMTSTGKAATEAAVKVQSFGEKLRDALQGAVKLPGEILEKWNAFATPFNQTLEIVNKLKEGFMGMYEMAKKAAEANEAREAFSQLAASMDRDADTIIAAVKKATGGQMSTSEISHGASSILRMGVSKDVSEIAKLYQIAEFKADQTGESIAAIMDKIADAIGKGTPRALLPLGLIPDSLARITDAEALTLSKTETLNAVLEQGSKQMMAAASETGNLEYMMGQLEGAITGVNPRMRELMEVEGSAADKMAAFEKEAESCARQIGEALIPAMETLVPIIRENVIPAIEALVAGLDIFFNTADERIDAILARQGSAGTRTQIKDEISTLQKEREQTEQSLARWEKAAGVALGGEDMKQQGIEKFRNTLRNIDGEIASLNKKLEGNETQRKSTAFYKEAGKAVDSLTSAYKAVTQAVSDYTKVPEKDHKAAADNTEKLNKLYADQATLLRNISLLAKGMEPPKVITDMTDGIKIMNQASMAAGGFSGAMKDGMTEAGKRMEEANKKAEEFKATLEKMRGVVYDVGRAFGGNFAAGFNGQADFSKMTPASTVQRMRDVLLGTTGMGAGVVGAVPLVINGDRGKIASDNDAKKQGEDFGKVFAKSVAEALNSALTDAFRQGNMFEGLTKGILNAVQQAVSQAKPIVSTTGGINWGNLGTNLAVNAVIGWATQPGRILGGTLTHGGEVPGQAQSINDQVNQAVAARNARNYIGASADTISQLNSWNPAYAGYSISHSGDGIFSAKTDTYQLNAEKASAALAKFAELMEKANEEMESSERISIMFQENAARAELSGNKLNSLEIKKLDAEKILKETWTAFAGSFSAERTPWSTMLNGGLGGLKPEQAQVLSDAQISVLSATRALEQFTDALKNSNKALVLKFPGSQTTSIINNDHIQDIVLGTRPAAGGSSLTNPADIAIRNAVGGILPDNEPAAIRASSKKSTKHSGPGIPEHPHWFPGVDAFPFNPAPAPVAPPSATAATQPIVWPVRGDPRAPNNGVPYAMPYVEQVVDETGFVPPTQFYGENYRRQAQSKSEKEQIDAVLKEFSATKAYTTRSLDQSRSEALNTLDSTDFSGAESRIKGHIAQLTDGLATIQNYMDEQAAEMKKASEENRVGDAITALERWKEGNSAYVAKWDETTQQQAALAQVSRERTSWANGLQLANSAGWQNLALSARYGQDTIAGGTPMTMNVRGRQIQVMSGGQSYADMATAGMFGETPDAVMNYMNALKSGGGYTQDQITKMGRNKTLQLQGQAWQANSDIDTDLQIRMMKAQASGNQTEIAAVMGIRHDAASNAVTRLKSDVERAMKGLEDVGLSEAEYARRSETFRATNEAYNQARMDEAQMAIDQQQALKEKNTAYINDILSTLITRVGETQQVGGQTVLVLSGGQPDGLALANKIKDSVAGLDPELAKVIQDFIDATPQVRWNGA